MIHLKTKEEIAKVRRAALMVSRTLGMLASEVKPGVTTLQLDKLAEEFVLDHGAKPSFKGLYGFPNACCISVGAQVVHGIPNKEPLREGDIVSIDFGAEVDGYHGDHAYTFAVGEIDPRVAKLLKVTKDSLYRRPRKTTTSATSAMPSNAIARTTDTAWCVNSAAMAWARKCTKTPWCPITARAVMASGSKTGWCWPSNR